MAHKENRITYSKLFWLFIMGSLLGVLLEGVFCLFCYGHWETHVVSVWGHFCIIYGFGASGIYAGSVLMERKNTLTKFVTFAVIATVVEYLCGALLKYALDMKAWDYHGKFLNIDGIICLQMTFVWGLLGVLFSKYAVSPLEKLFAKMNGKGCKVACVCLSVFMAVNLAVTSTVILRWSERHHGAEPKSKIGIYIDDVYNDDVMEKRFVEWKFLDAA